MNMKGIVQNPQMELLLFAVIEFHLHFTFQEAVKLWKCYKKLTYVTLDTFSVHLW